MTKLLNLTCFIVLHPGKLIKFNLRRSTKYLITMILGEIGLIEGVKFKDVRKVEKLKTLSINVFENLLLEQQGNLF